MEVRQNSTASFQGSIKAKALDHHMLFLSRSRPAILGKMSLTSAALWNIQSRCDWRLVCKVAAGLRSFSRGVSSLAI